MNRASLSSTTNLHMMNDFDAKPLFSSVGSQSDMTHAAQDAAKFLKSTLLLPSSTFPPRPRPSDLAKFLPRCTDDLYSWQRRERPAANTFRLHDGPPYANGDLHVGHALNKILKDIVCRSKLAQGHRVDYVPGWDCHGLPIELKALEQNGWKRGHGVDAVKIRDAAKAFAQKTIEKQMAGFKSWAVMGDWDGHWETMQQHFEVRQLEVFQAMAEHGLIYRKHKPVYWSPSSGTALAEAELEYKDDHESKAAYVKFPLKGASFSSSPVFALIWTTTPWTLPANQAIALNRSLEYCLLSTAQDMLVVARSRLESLKNVLGPEVTIIQDSLEIDQLLDCTYDGLPQFGPRAANRPIIAADFVTAESGTGLVHCAPGHGMEDYQALQALIRDGRVEVLAPVDGSGRFDATASPAEENGLVGLDVFTEGNDAVLTHLRESGLLVHQHSHKHKYPIDWRTKEPVIIRATAQWFADLTSIRGDALSAIERVSFIPSTGKNRLHSFIQNRTEWCISRQRSWGVPIPAVYHRESGEVVLSAESLGHIIAMIKERGTDAWFSDRGDDPAWIPPSLNPSQYRRGADTMDVWFDSGTSWTSMLSDTNRDGPLADFYIEGTDQHRGWFQSSLLTRIAHQRATDHASQRHAPFQNLITHGFTLDAQGKKMSKSLGNVISPNEIISGLGPMTRPVVAKASKKGRETHPLGPDALRLWVASSDWTKDIVISDTVVRNVHTALDKYRVTIKLILGLLQDFDPKFLVPYKELETLDRIALLQLHDVSQAAQKSYSNLEFHQAMGAINRWVVTDLSGFYFEAIKDVCYCEPKQSKRRLSVCTTLHHIFQNLQQMLAPICPLLVEESWEHSSGSYREAIQHPLKKVWEEPPTKWSDHNSRSILPLITAVNTAVKSAQELARSDKLLGQSLASEVRLYVQPGKGADLVRPKTWEEILVVSKVQVIEQETFQKAAAEEAEYQDRAWTRSRDIVDVNGSQFGTAAVVSPALEKCGRCWKHSAESVAEEQIPLCARCSTVVHEFRTGPQQ